MPTKKITLPALGLLAALAGAAGLGPWPAPHAAAQANGDSQRAMTEHFQPGRHIEGRIAYLKAELKITDSQQPQFDRLAAVMRDGAKEMEQAAAQLRGNRGQPQSAVERLEIRTRFATLRAQQSQRFLDAFKPLYASLSDDQKKTADELLASHHHHRA
jgi:ABC-type sugar transport system substrate-binding protein